MLLIAEEGFDVASLLKGDYLTNNLMQKVNDFYESQVPELKKLVQRVY